MSKQFTYNDWTEIHEVLGLGVIQDEVSDRVLLRVLRIKIRELMNLVMGQEKTKNESITALRAWVKQFASKKGVDGSAWRGISRIKDDWTYLLWIKKLMNWMWD